MKIKVLGFRLKNFFYVASVQINFKDAYQLTLEYSIDE